MSNKYFQDIKIDFVEDTKTMSKIVAEPFERGYGVTIGNGLRRTLLTALPGAAVTSIKIDGVAHEFSTIEGVTEDVSEIILNLKKIRFKMSDDATSELITFDFEGPGDLTSGVLNDYLNDFEVINKKNHIATINKKSKLSFELRISRGKGYSPSEKNKRPDDNLGTICIDAIYNPVVNVSWEVEPIAASTEGHERLVMSVFSDGSSSPRDCINHASNIMRQHLGYFLFNDSKTIKAVNDEELNIALEIKSTLLKTIDEMELSVRSHNCLQAAGIKTIGELVSKEENEMLKFKNFGRKSLTELTEKLDELNLKFGMNVDNYLQE
ncbi:MAG: DNA-directed RNA polymerase subunit alpha [Candidatus Marinimicrobia bacterium]|nr:DNA-directed RNA polymerase subunit alpha [Candidatus Neomarinimicrobiota bacterium]|tara:strand:- start:2463 stop:3431 length:969 start_codon:yes stop_codon:yes gene_type:complete